MENKEEIIEAEPQYKATIHFTPEAEKECYVELKKSLIKVLYMIEDEIKTGESKDSFFYGFMYELVSSNNLCHEKLTKVVVKMCGLFHDNHYKQMTHQQIKSQIMESRGIVEHLIKDLSSKSK